MQRKHTNTLYRGERDVEESRTRTDTGMDKDRYQDRQTDSEDHERKDSVSGPQVRRLADGPAD